MLDRPAAELLAVLMHSGQQDIIQGNTTVWEIRGEKLTRSRKQPDGTLQPGPVVTLTTPDTSKPDEIDYGTGPNETLFRARVLARWATVLLAIGGLVSAALSMMPDAFYRLLAFPNGVAMIGLGYSLWRVAGQDGERTGRVAEARREQAAV